MYIYIYIHICFIIALNNHSYVLSRCLSFDSYIILWDLFESPGELREGCSLGGKKTGNTGSGPQKYRDD
jgi:hypothetical protein